jgi:hypothetical protein
MHIIQSFVVIHTHYSVDEEFDRLSKQMLKSMVELENKDISKENDEVHNYC